MDANSILIRARWLIPVTRPPIENGWIVVRQGRIQSIGQGEGRSPDLDLGDSVVFPALINAHTHLEFSDLTEPLGTSGMAFPDWIREVIRRRDTRNRSTPEGDSAVGDSAAVARGWDQLRNSATAFAGEIVALPSSSRTYADIGFRGVVFHERLGLSADSVDTTCREFEQMLDRESARPSTHLRHGISPHAPYSVHWQLFQALVEIAERRGLPVAMHLAESRDELELLRHRRGPFRRLLSDLGVWHPDAWPGPLSPIDYLRSLARANRVLLVHGNYLNDMEMDYLASERNRFSIAYCPRTHEYFGHEPYPLAKFLQRRINVAVGTDSRASNPDLSVAADLQAAAKRFPQLSEGTVLEMATLNAAKALSVEADLGSLDVGKLAWLAAVGIPSGDIGRKPLETLLAEFHRAVRSRRGLVQAVIKSRQGTGFLMIDERAAACALKTFLSFP